MITARCRNSAQQHGFGTNVDLGKGIQPICWSPTWSRTARYSVIERKALDKILAEQNFSNSNRADPNSAAKIGKLLGVDAIIVGSITEFGNETKKTRALAAAAATGMDWALGGFGHSNSNANVAITARIVNIDTAEILGVADGKGQSARSSTGMRWRRRQLERLRRRRRRLRLQQLPEHHHRRSHQERRR